MFIFVITVWYTSVIVVIASVMVGCFWCSYNASTFVRLYVKLKNFQNI